CSRGFRRHPSPTPWNPSTASGARKPSDTHSPEWGRRMNEFRTDVPDAPRFKDRQEAARLLVQALDRCRGRHPLVLGIPRGGVVLAGILARGLEGDLDVALVRKLGAPGAPEFAIGSITEHGLVILNEGWEDVASASYLQAEIEEALALLRRRREAYTP